MIFECCKVVARCIDEMPRECMLWVDFRELRAEPLKVLHRVLRFLTVDGTIDPDAIAGVEHAVAHVPIHAGSSGGTHGYQSADVLETLMAAARVRFR
jgi:hypothetical protein